MRLEQLTFTRFLAAISIVFFHYSQTLYPFNQEVLKFLISQANIGVSYFFILSGFVMLIAYHSQAKLSPTAYYLNRFARIYPVYLIGLIAIWLNEHQWYSVSCSIVHLTMLQSFFPEWVLNFSLPNWSVSVEIFFYALFPLIFNLVYRKRHFWKRAGIGILIFWILSQIIFHYLLGLRVENGDNLNFESFLFYSPFLHLNEFLMGNLTAMIFIQNYQTATRNYSWFLGLLMVLMVITLKYNRVFNFHNGLFAVFFVPFILALSLNKGRLNDWLNKPVLVYLGDISYSLYIYQYPVFYYSRGLTTGWPTLDFLLKFVVLILVSSLSYSYVETPLRKRIKAWGNHKERI